MKAAREVSKFRRVVAMLASPDRAVSQALEAGRGTSGASAHLGVATAQTSTLGNTVATKADLSAVDKVRGDLTTSIGTKADASAVEKMRGDLTTSIGTKADVSAVDKVRSDLTTTIATKADVSAVDKVRSDLTTTIATKADASAVDKVRSDLTTTIAGKADVSAVDKVRSDLTTSIGTKADVSAVDKVRSDLTTTIAGKADAAVLEKLRTDVNSSIADLGRKIGQGETRMLISSVATAVDSETLVAGAQNWLVTQPAGEAPRRFFQDVLYLRFPTDAFTSGFVVDDAATVLTGSFGPHTYDGLHPDNPALAAKVTAAGANLMVQLDGPRQVLAVAPKGSYSMELYRVDAGTVAAQPTETTSDGNGILSGPAFTDVTFAVVLKSGGTAKAAPTVNDFKSISLRGYPTGPRLGIADPALQSIDFFWRANGQVGTTVPAGAGAALAKALTRYLDSAWQALKGAPPPGRFEPAPRKVL
jgi:uncharacterized protein YjbI with pentapeptide repeats